MTATSDHTTITTDTPAQAWERRHNAGVRAELTDNLLASLQERQQELRDQRTEFGWLVPADAPAHVKDHAARLDGQLEELGQMLITVRGMKLTRVDYYDFDTANRRRPVEQVHRDHAAHADVCAICRQDDHDTRIGRRLAERVERLRGLLGSLATRLTLTRAGEKVTPKAAAKALEVATRELDKELAWLPENTGPQADVDRLL